MEISVIIPCHNAEPFLEDALSSLLEQTRVPDEIIVVDDRSSDGSGDLARRFGPLVHVVEGDFGGASAARNRGYALATGESLMFLDADDVLGPTTIAGLADALKRVPGQIAVAPWYRLELRRGQWVRRPPSCAPRRPDHDDLQAWLSGWYHPPCSLMWSREAYEMAQPWDLRALVNNDGDMVMRALARGRRLVRALDGEGYYRRISSGNSVSGARFTREGRLAQMYVLDKLTYVLCRRGLLKKYRRELASAYDRLAREGAEFADVAAMCQDRAGDLAGPAPVRRIRSRADRLVGSPDARHGQRSLWDSTLTRYPLPMDQPLRAIVPTDEVPLVSVIIPTFNRAGTLGTTIRSVLRQTLGDLEILIVDDGSEDGTEEVVVGFSDPRLRYIKQQNAGAGAARNRGIAESRGKFVAFLDADDSWLPEKLERQVRRLQESGVATGLIYCGVENVWDNHSTTVTGPECRGDLSAVLLRRNVIHGTSGVMVRRTVLDDVGGFDESFPAIEDYDLWIRIAQKYRIEYVDDPLVRYYDGAAEGRLSNNPQKNFLARRLLFEKHQGVMQSSGASFPFLADSISRCLAHGETYRMNARRLALQALRRRPLSLSAFRLVLRTTLPSSVVDRMRRLRSAIS